MSAVVSVVVPTRNRAALLAQTLHTVGAQQVPLEVVVVDEASTDDTPAMLSCLTDPRVRTIRHPAPQGPSAARNTGSDATTGRWIAFVDDDDLWLPGKLERQIAAAEAVGAPWSYGGSMLFAHGPRLLGLALPTPGQDLSRELPWANVVPGGASNVIVRRDAFDAAGGFDPTLPFGEEWDLWIRLLQVGAPSTVPEPVVAYRVHGGNVTNRLDDMVGGIREIDRRYRHLRNGAPLDWAAQYRWMTVWALRAGDRAAARRFAARGLRAGDRGAMRRLVRSLLPLEPSAGPADRRGVRCFAPPGPRQEAQWPPGSREWLEDVLRIEPPRPC